MAGISTHILDTARGRPAAQVPVRLEIFAGGSFRQIGAGLTDSDGRNRGLLGETALIAGRYRLTFDTAAYAAATGGAAFFPEVQIVFEISDATQHYHVPLLLSPFGYSTYRGS